MVRALGAPRVTIDFDFHPSMTSMAARTALFAADIRSFREPLNRSVREVMIPSIQENFDAEGRPPWQELAEGTISQRGAAHPILQRSGALRRAAIALARWAIDSESAVYIASSGPVAYAAIHQFGGGDIPARPFVGMQPEDEEKIDRVFSTWIGERLVRSGLSGVL